MVEALSVKVPSGFQFDLDENNDIFIGSNGNFAGVYGQDAVRIVCECCARTVRGEMIFATDKGMPYYEAIWNGSPNPIQFEAAFRSRISKVKHVREIVTLETRIVSGVFQYSAVIMSDFGEIALNG